MGVKTKNGKTREIDCDVLVDSTGRELPGQEFDESGRCVNENEVLSRAANSGQIPPGSAQQSYGNDQSYGNPQQSYGYEQSAQHYGAPQMNHYPTQPYGQSYGYGPQSSYPPQPYGSPGFGAPQMNPYPPQPYGAPGF